MFLKKKSSTSGITNIVTLNPYVDKHYIYKSNAFYTLNNPTFNISNFITSYVRNKDIITTVVYLSRSIPEEDIQDILDIKAYEELGLDQANSYTISSIEVMSDSEEREFHLFVAEHETLDATFLPLKTETKYIDLIIPAPLLYKSLYQKEIISKHGTHCFVYFTQDDTFVTMYHNGEYIYAKSIEFSLEQIYEKYCVSVGEKVDEKTFFAVLESEGLTTSNPDYQQHFKKIFSEVFITINDIIIYTKRAFNIDTIDQMFIGSEGGSIIGTEEYSQNFLGLQSLELNFNYHIPNDESYTDQIQYMMLLSSLVYMEDESLFVNLTMYPRPPSFLNRTSGQFIISTVAAISLSLAYPLVYLIGSYVNDAKIYALTIENNTLTAESNKYKQILSEKKKIIDGLNENIKALSDKYNNKAKTLTAIYDKKVNYHLKSEILHTVAEDLGKFEVYVDELKNKDNTIQMSLVSSDDRKFTELIKYISETHFANIASIDIDKIEKDASGDFYRGLLKVELK
jgi:Tfp pilus assembly protein PilN